VAFPSGEIYFDTTQKTFYMKAFFQGSFKHLYLTKKAWRIGSQDNRRMRVRHFIYARDCKITVRVLRSRNIPAAGNGHKMASLRNHLVGMMTPISTFPKTGAYHPAKLTSLDEAVFSYFSANIPVPYTFHKQIYSDKNMLKLYAVLIIKKHP